MGVRLERKKPRNWLFSLAYRLPLSLDLWLDLERITERMAHERSARLGLHRLERNAFLLDRIEPTDSVLDLGCGDGQVAGSIKAKRVVGIDHNPEMIRRAKQSFPNAEFAVGDAREFLTDHFDVLVMSHVLEHLDDPDGILSFAHNFDRIYIEVPDFDAHHLNHVRKKRKRSLIYTDADHVAEFDRNEMKKMLDKAGLIIDSEEYKFGMMKFWVRPNQPSDHRA